MTLIGYDLFDHLCNTLRAGGFSRVKPLSTRSKQKADVYGRNGVLAVVHGPYKITAKPQNDLFGEQSLSPSNIQTEFEDHLKKIMHLIDRLITTLRPQKMVIIFQSDGTLIMPDWFIIRCDRKK